MAKHIAANFLTLAIVILMALGVAAAWGKREYAAPGPLTQAICLQVKPGSSFRSVAAQLAERGAISSAYLFKVGADYAGKSSQLKAGSFLVQPGATMREITDLVTAGGASTCGADINFRIAVNGFDVVVREMDAASGEVREVAKFKPAEEPAPEPYARLIETPDVRLRVTVAEGVTSWQVVEGLKNTPVLKGDLPEIPPEGSLAPDSYEVERGAERSALVARMTEAQSARLATAWNARAPGLPYETPEEALVMASLVEKETGVAEERPLVSSVFRNRLDQGMKLQTDPAVIYGVTGGKGVLGRGLRASELRKETPYNTYVIEGLPPTPIANPGLKSIEATLNPASTKYIFFVADGSGGHAFAETLEEHNRNVAKWRALEQQQQGN